MVWAELPDLPGGLYCDLNVSFLLGHGAGLRPHLHMTEGKTNEITSEANFQARYGETLKLGGGEGLYAAGA